VLKNQFRLIHNLDAPLTGRDGVPIAAGAPDGSLWLATAHNVFQLRDDRIATTLSGSADLLAIAPDGSLWLTAKALSSITRTARYSGPVPRSTGKGGLYCRFASGPLRRLERQLYLAAAGALGILSPSGAFSWKTAEDGLPPGRILRLFEDRQGALWLSTEGTVARYASGRFETLRARSGAAAIEDFYEDREGNLWLGTDSAGLLALREQRFTTLTTADGLPGDAVRTLLPTRRRLGRH